jgi:HPt (histidine-containing phosphotransfer) domain-containing protein
MTDNQQTESIIDIDVALTYTAGDRDMLVSIAELFLEEGKEQLRAVQTGVEEGDPVQTSNAAHKLKGSITIFGASAAAAAAVEVELAAKANDSMRINSACDALNREMKRLFGAIEKLCCD